MYVDKHLEYKVLDNMTTAADNILECITAEIWNERNQNVITSCVGYREHQAPALRCVMNG